MTKGSVEGRESWRHQPGSGWSTILNNSVVRERNRKKRIERWNICISHRGKSSAHEREAKRKTGQDKTKTRESREEDKTVQGKQGRRQNKTK